jgi:hypothetical protein
VFAVVISAKTVKIAGITTQKNGRINNSVFEITIPDFCSRKKKITI